MASRTFNIPKSKGTPKSFASPACQRLSRGRRFHRSTPPRQRLAPCYDGGMISIIVAGVVLWLLPIILRGFAFGLLVVGAVLALHVVLLAAVALAQQQTRTTCYDSFPARICETFDGMGNVISKSRCYRSGNETRCDTQTFGAPQSVGPDAGWRYSPPNGDRLQR